MVTRKRKTAKKILTFMTRHTGECAKINLHNSFELLFWTGARDAKPKCSIGGNESHCYVGFKYTSWKPLPVYNLAFGVEIQHKHAQFKNSKLANWGGEFKGIRPHLAMNGTDRDHDYDRAEIEVVDANCDEFINATFQVPADDATNGLQSVSSRIHITT